MQWDAFKTFISKILIEGNRLQKFDITGAQLTKKWFTDTQLFSLLASCLFVTLLPQGLTENFSEYAIAFLGIFVGLFTNIIISLYEKSKNIYVDYDKKNNNEKARIEVLRNYLVQFTGLTSYSIILALFAVILLLGVLLFPITRIDIRSFKFVQSFSEINIITISNFVKVFILIIFRYSIFYLLLNFFIITLFATSSYFSFLLSEYNNLKPSND